jgi:hypothetical protein
LSENLSLKNNKNIIAGLGEIGMPIYKLLKKNSLTLGYDLNPDLMNTKQFKKYENLKTSFLHICIPFSKNFIANATSLFFKFQPKCIVIHSTLSPNTTKQLQKKLPVPVIYSATRGIHKRMIHDFKRYTKFFAIESNAPRKNWAIKSYVEQMKKCKIKTKQMSTPLTLELSKIVVDTSYYGWLINYAQLSNMIAMKHGVDFDEMWSFSDEIHKFLGNRPKMYPGFIGGHCVIPNLELINDEQFWQIDKLNNIYLKKVKNAKSIAKKYVKGKQSYTSNP